MKNVYFVSERVDREMLNPMEEQVLRGYRATLEAAELGDARARESLTLGVRPRLPWFLRSRLRLVVSGSRIFERRSGRAEGEDGDGAAGSGGGGGGGSGHQDVLNPALVNFRPVQDGAALIAKFARRRVLRLSPDDFADVLVRSGSLTPIHFFVPSISHALEAQPMGGLIAMIDINLPNRDGSKVAPEALGPRGDLFLAQTVACVWRGVNTVNRLCAKQDQEALLGAILERGILSSTMTAIVAKLTAPKPKEKSAREKAAEEAASSKTMDAEAAEAGEDAEEAGEAENDEAADDEAADDEAADGEAADAAEAGGGVEDA